MALIWIVTIGNSDVKLTSDDEWGHLRESKRSALNPCYGDFSKPTEESDGLLSLPARVLGIIYGDALETHWKHFSFPLLSAFIKEIRSNKKNQPDRIIVLLTDQTKIFLDSNDESTYDRSDSDSPYWKDTCCLKPIFQKYFDEEFGKNKVEFYDLKPDRPNEGLDNWDSTLRLVQKEFDNWNISRGDRVIVSHQAGTPAISSAIQLTALMKFGKKVQFLVSSEFIKNQAYFLPGSSYFDTLQIQEAQQLLARFDYAGVKRALDKIELKDPEKQANLNHLLDLSELWNAAKFDDFASKMGEPADSRSKEWWWKGYEMAYLAWIRMRQESPTEALFHSVRAVEGLICEWVIKTHSAHIWYKFFETDNNGIYSLDEKGMKIPEYHHQRFRGHQEGSPVAKKTIDNRFKLELFENQRNALQKDKLGIYGQTLYTLFKVTFEGSIQNHPINIVWEQLADERNELFHRLKGITEQEVYDAWGCNNKEKWEKVLFECISLVSEIQNPVFKSLKQASLMSKVHQKLENLINNLLPKS